MSDPFANRARELVVAPRACTGLRVRRDIRCSEHEAALVNHHAASALLSENRSHPRCRIAILLRMAIEATEHPIHQIFAMGQPLWCALELAIGESARSGSQHGSPTDRDRNQNGQNGRERRATPGCNSSKSAGLKRHNSFCYPFLALQLMRQFQQGAHKKTKDSPLREQCWPRLYLVEQSFTRDSLQVGTANTVPFSTEATNLLSN